MTINGDSWRTRRRDDGDFGAPDGWPEDIRGTLTRQSETRAVFVSDEIPEVLVFRPAPNALYICG